MIRMILIWIGIIILIIWDLILFSFWIYEGIEIWKGEDNA